MSIETKLNLTNEKFCQTDGSLLTLSGDTRISSIGTIRYETNQSGSFTPRSLTDVGYVTGLTSQLCTTANNGITKTGYNFRLGGALTGNTSISGAYTLSICGSANLNTINGYQISGNTVLKSPTGNANTIYIGNQAGATGNTGNNDIGIGYNTLRKLVNGSGEGYNVAVGYQAMCNNASGDKNVAIGTNVMAQSCDGSNNIGVGNQALLISCGNNNVAIGENTLCSNQGGNFNVAIGCDALRLNVSGCENTAIGSQALYNNNGCNNVAIGQDAGYSTTGNSSVFIGKFAGCAETGSNKLYIANNAVNTLIYGDFNTNEITLPKIKICETPSIGVSTDNLLVWNSSDKCVKVIDGGAVLTSAVTGATNGLSKTGQKVKLGGALTGNTAITGAYTLSICGGALLNTDKGYQVSGSTVLRTSPNSNTNILLGVSAGNNTMTGTNNSAMGFNALNCNTTGSKNSAMGYCALRNNTCGSNNSVMGYDTLINNTTGSDNSAIGSYALYANTIGSNNSAIGSYALYANTTGSNNSAMGYCALIHNTTGYNNSAMGFNALYSNNTVNNLIAIGYNALYNNKCVNASCQGCYNMAVGHGALSGNTYGSYNHAYGYGALSGNTTGCFNVANGYRALNKNTTGCWNSAMGNYALYSNTTGGDNSAMGFNALYCNTYGCNNSAMGYAALQNNTTGCYNSAMGGSALYNNTTGCYNSAIGSYALNFNTSGSNNSAIGFAALLLNTTGSYNSAMGGSALYNNTTGCYNVANGYIALYNNTTGCNNVALGNESGYLNVTGNSSVYIGRCAGYNNTTSGKLYIATGATKNLIYGDFVTNEITLPKLKLCETPTTGSSSDNILVWNSTDKCVKAISGGAVLTSAITGATNGLTKIGQNVKLGGTLTGNTVISGSSTLCITSPSINTDIQYFKFNSNPTEPTTTGSLYYKNNTLNFNREFSGVTLQIGEETVVRVRNVTGSLIPNGTAVYICGAVAGIPTIAKTIASTSSSAINTLGLTTMNIADNNEGYVTILGQVHDIDTSSWSVGCRLYLSATQAGCLTTTPPSYPNDVIHLGYVTCQAALGSILVVPDVETPYTSIGAFTGYTACTDIKLNNKLNTCVFNTYTGNTAPIINGLTSMCVNAVTGVTNGISKIDCHNITLGGTLNSPTIICGVNSLKFGDLCGITLSTQCSTDIILNSKICGGVYIKSQVDSCDTATDFTCSVGIAIDYDAIGGFAIYDNRVGGNQSGIVYAADYSTNYVNRSLVDKAYVDSVATGLDVKSSVLVATTGNITLSGLTTVDGILLTTGDRVLVKDQLNDIYNGIYSASTGTWGRVSDYDFSPSGEISNGDLIPVLTGNTNSNSNWILTTQNPIFSGDSLVFSKFSQQAGIVDGNGINVTSVGSNKQISVELSPSSCGLRFNGTGLEFDYSTLRLGLCCGTGGYLDVRATSGAAVGSEIPVKINTGGTNTLYVDSSTISTCIGTPIICANNGLTKSGSNVRLGGSLTGSTTINGSSNALTFCCVSALGIGYTTSATITDGSGTPRGLVYAADYSSTYCNRSLVDKAYVDSKVTSDVLACNGLTKVNNTVILGGALTGNTFISYGANRLCFINGGTSCMDMISDCSQIHVENTSLCLRSCTFGSCVGSVCITNTGIVSLSSNATTCGVRITAPSTGAIYNADYSSGFINESLVTKRYVTGITNTFISTANNGLTKSGTNVRLGGALTGNTAITGAYTLSVCSGALLNTDKGYQVSGSTVLRTSPNSNTNILLGVSAGNNTMTGTNNSAMGYAALQNNTCGFQNSAIGSGALQSNTSGFYNSAIGTGALQSNTTGYQNSAMGTYALYSNTTGSNNSAMGYNALYSNTTGSNNSAIGSYALYANTTGCYNSAMGFNALLFNTSGSNNSAMGGSALQNNTSGCNNSAMGFNALYSNTTGCLNSAMGYRALYSNTTGCNNSALGYQALNCNNTVNNLIAIGTNALYNNTCVNSLCQGCYNMAVGHGALSGNTYGCGNHAFGYGALSGNTYGCFNNAFGYQALNKNITGCNNTAIGCKSLYSMTTGNNNFAVGIGALCSNLSSWNNVAIGEEALYSTTGEDNVGIGYNSLYNNTSGYDNLAIGYKSLTNVVSGCHNIGIGCLTGAGNGQYNIALGGEALRNNYTGGENFAAGCQALYFNNSGNYNIAVGSSALYCNCTGSHNIANGFQTLSKNTTGCNNVAYGSGALFCNVNGSNNVATGHEALCWLRCGDSNIANGYQALTGMDTGCSNVGIGMYSMGNLIAGDYNIAIGAVPLGNMTQGCYNIAIGRNAGNNASGTVVGKLFIATGATKNLIYGDFITNEVTLPKLKLCETPATGACTDSVLVWNSSDKCVKQVNGSALNGVYSVTGITTNASLSPSNQVIFANTTSGSITITLPAAAAISDGKTYIIKNTACGLINNVIVDSGAGSTIDGSRCALINTDYGSLQLIRACTIGTCSIWYTLSFIN